MESRMKMAEIVRLQEDERFQLWLASTEDSSRMAQQEIHGAIHLLHEFLVEYFQ